MILTDDNFASIEAAVEEGRGVYDNLTKFIVWIIPTNLGESLMLLCAIMLGLPLPLVPLQLLWINLTDTVLGLSLAFEPKEGDVMNRPPRPTQQPLLPWPLILRSGLVSSIMLAVGLGVFLWELRMEKRRPGLRPNRCGECDRAGAGLLSLQLPRFEAQCTVRRPIQEPLGRRRSTDDADRPGALHA